MHVRLYRGLTSSLLYIGPIINQYSDLIMINKENYETCALIAVPYFSCSLLVNSPGNDQKTKRNFTHSDNKRFTHKLQPIVIFKYYEMFIGMANDLAGVNVYIRGRLQCSNCCQTEICLKNVGFISCVVGKAILLNMRRGL